MGRPLQFEKFTGLLLCFQILPAALIIYSLVRYPGPKALHLVLLLIIPAWFWLVVGGFLLLHGE
jgi:hypothetical protein